MKYLRKPRRSVRYWVARFQIRRGRSPKVIGDGQYDCTPAFQAMYDAQRGIRS